MRDEDWYRICEDENDPDYWDELINRTGDEPYPSHRGCNEYSMKDDPYMQEQEEAMEALNKWHEERNEKLGKPLADNLLTLFKYVGRLDDGNGGRTEDKYMVIVAEHTLERPVQGGDLEKELLVPITHVWAHFVPLEEMDKDIDEITLDFHDYKSWQSIHVQPDSYLTNRHINPEDLKRYREEDKYPSFMKHYDHYGYIYNLDDFYTYLAAVEYHVVFPSCNSACLIWKDEEANVHLETEVPF